MQWDGDLRAKKGGYGKRGKRTEADGGTQANLTSSPCDTNARRRRQQLGKSIGSRTAWGKHYVQAAVVGGSKKKRSDRGRDKAELRQQTRGAGIAAGKKKRVTDRMVLVQAQRVAVTVQLKGRPTQEASSPFDSSSA